MPIRQDALGNWMASELPAELSYTPVAGILNSSLGLRPGWAASHAVGGKNMKKNQFVSDENFDDVKDRSSRSSVI